MDIRNWPMEKIMQLPDCIFGQRYIVSCNVEVDGEASSWDISEIAFPDICVFWTLGIYWYYHKGHVDYIRLALGDQLPTTQAMMSELEPLINGYGMQGPGPREIHSYLNSSQEIVHMKKLISAQGKRMIIEGHSTGTGAVKVRAYVEVSSIPKEVPDWLASELGS